jgi:hypothetical protein
MGLQRYVSTELTHFLGKDLENDDARYALLVKIILGGWLTHPPHDPTAPFDEHFEAEKPISADGLAVRGIVCFCDIPIHDYKIHMTKYSHFGLSFAKSHLVKRGASPVYYVANDSLVLGPVLMTKSPQLERRLRQAAEAGELQRDLYFDNMAMSMINVMSALLYLVGDHKTLDTPSQWSQHELETNMKISLKHLFSLDDGEYDRLYSLLRGKVEAIPGLKAFSHFLFFHLLGFVKGFDSNLQEDDPNNYYMEREWRVLGNMPFARKDVQRVIFPRAYAERFRQDVPDYFGQIQFADAE